MPVGERSCGDSGAVTQGALVSAPSNGAGGAPDVGGFTAHGARVIIGCEPGEVGLAQGAVVAALSNWEGGNGFDAVPADVEWVAGRGAAHGARIVSIGGGGNSDASGFFDAASCSRVSEADHRNIAPKGKCCTTGSLPSTSLSYILSIP